MKSPDKNSSPSKSVAHDISISSTSLADENEPPPTDFHTSIDYTTTSLDDANTNQNQNYDEDSITDDIRQFFRVPYQPQPSQSSIQHHSRRPGPEWVYPSERITTQNVQRDPERSFDSSSTPYIIDQSQTVVIPTIDGVVVPNRRCYLKICGIRIFDDEFPYKINRKLLPIILIIIVICSTFGGNLNSSRKQSSTIIPSTSTTNSPLEVFDIRVMNITEILFNMSGPSILETNTPQNKALTWILDEDGLNLTYCSPNLVQRYALMVMYYSLSGEKWFNNEGYGSDQSECQWFGINCETSQRIEKLLLRSIDLSNNGLEGKLVREIGVFSKLEDMILGENRISGSIPTEIGMLAELQKLDVPLNDLSGTIPDVMIRNKNIEWINIESNRISGTIPSYLGALRVLQHIVFAGNQLTGTIPSNLPIFVLSQLSFFDNKLIGTIPPELGSCQLLESLILGKNSLTGTIPSTLGNLTSLKILKLGGNMLTGTIPETLGSLTKLNEIFLSHNMINGTIPLSFNNLGDLQALGLHNNMIRGEVSEKICGFSLRVLTADCASVEAEVSCSCCTKCY